MLPNFNKIMFLQPSIVTNDFSKADLAFANYLNDSKSLLQIFAWSPHVRKKPTPIKHMYVPLTSKPNMALTSGNTF